MTEERDEAVSRRYRELGAEEPPRALDDAILAAARRPARNWSRRWSVPLSLAAVVVLSVTVTLNVQREAPERVTAEARKQTPKTVEPAAAPEAPRAPSQPDALRQKPFAAAPPAVAEATPAPPPGSPAPAIASRAERDSAAGALSAPREAREDQAADRARVAPMAKRMQVQETPEQELERIAQLRKGGQHDEADKALAEFRKRLPDYKIPDAMLEKVERR